MESHKTSSIKAGIFVAIGIVVLGVTILLLGGDQMFLRPSYYLHVELEEVGGLGKGSVVSLAGFPVGNIDKIEFVPGTDRLRVWMEIDEAYQERITDQAEISVKTQGALGDKYLYIEPGDVSQGTALKDEQQVAASSEADLIDVLTEKGKELTQVVDVVRESHKLLAALNANGRSAKLMRELLESSREMKMLFAESRQMVLELRNQATKNDKMKESLHHLASVMEKIDRGEGTLGALVNDPSIHEKLKTVLGAKPRNKFLKPLIRESIKVSED